MGRVWWLGVMPTVPTLSSLVVCYLHCGVSGVVL